MPAIPIPVSRVDLGAGERNPLDRSYMSPTSERTTPDQYGAQVGVATQQLGQTIIGAASENYDAWLQNRERKRGEDVANAVAQTNLAVPALEAQKEAPPDGAGVVQSTFEKQRTLIDQRAGELFPYDPRGATEYKKHMYASQVHYNTSAATFEASQSATHSKEQADSSLATLLNKVRVDPTLYNQTMLQGHGVIDASLAIPEYSRDSYKKTWEKQITNAYFEGKIQQAKTPEEMKAIGDELTKGTGAELYQGRLASADFEKLFNKTTTAFKKDEVEALKANFAPQLDTLANQIQADPAKFEEARKQGMDAIDGLQLGDTAKSELRRSWDSTSAAARFESGVRSATTADTLAAQEGELKQGVWQQRLEPKDYKSLLTHIDNQKKVLATKANTDATTAITDLEARTKDGILVPSENFQAVNKLVTASSNPVTQTRFARVVRDQQLLAQSRGLPPDQLYNLADRARGGPGSTYPGLPPEVSGWVSEASTLFPGVPASYLGATATREYGVYFGRNTANPGTTDYGKGTLATRNGVPITTATGLFQFTDSTWQETVDDPRTRAAMATAGYDLSKMSPQQITDLRKDGRASTIAAAALAAQNKSTLENALQRPVSDGELYLAHFLGAGGATVMLKAYNNAPDLPAAGIMPKAAASNAPVFYANGGTGKALTVKQVVDQVQSQFVASPSGVAYGDSEFYKKKADTTKKALESNPYRYATVVDGTQPSTKLETPADFAARGNVFNAVGQYYRLPREDNKPFDTEVEVPAIQKKFKDGMSEEVVGLLTSMSAMDKVAPGSLTAGLKQVGEEHSAYGVAAQLVSGDAPDVGTASLIVRGTKRIGADKTLDTSGKHDEATTAFTTAVGGALYGIPPDARNAIFKAAQAHYAETSAMENRTAFDDKAFGRSVNAVMGSGAGTPRIGSVNGATTVLPSGVTEKQMNTAVDRLIDTDLLRLGVDKQGRNDGSVPVYSDGKPVSANEITTQGTLRYLGAGQYAIQMSDKKYLVTRNPPVPMGEAPGIKEAGNIDLNARPVVRNADGSVSTVRSMSIGTDQGEVLIPTVAHDGSKILSNEEAIAQYKTTGKHLGVFDTPANATTYALRLHEAQASQYTQLTTPYRIKLDANTVKDLATRPADWLTKYGPMGERLGVPRSAGEP